MRKGRAGGSLPSLPLTNLHSMSIGYSCDVSLSLLRTKPSKFLTTFPYMAVFPDFSSSLSPFFDCDLSASLNFISSNQTESSGCGLTMPTMGDYYFSSLRHAIASILETTRYCQNSSSNSYPSLQLFCSERSS